MLENVTKKEMDVYDFVDFMEENSEEASLSFLKNYTLSESEVQSVLNFAALFGCSKIVESYATKYLSNKDFINGLLEWSIQNSNSSTAIFHYILEKVDPTIIEPTVCYSDEPLLYTLMNHEDYQDILITLYEKLSFSDKDFEEIINAIKYEKFDKTELERLLFISQNNFFKKINENSKEVLLKKIIYYLNLDFESNFTLCDEHSLFLEFLNSKNIPIKSLEILHDIALFNYSHIEQLFQLHTEDEILNVLDNSDYFQIDIDMKYFLYLAASYGFTKILQKNKDIITKAMLTDLLNYAISTECETKCEIQTANYLLSEFRTECFELTPELIQTIKENQLSDILLILFKNDKELSYEFWKNLFNGVDAFNDMIEVFCSDKIFKDMPFEFRTLLLDTMNHRNQYLNINLSNSNIFKSFAKKYGDTF